MLQGVPKRGVVGFLSLFEAFDNVEVLRTWFTLATNPVLKLNLIVNPINLEFRVRTSGETKL